MNTTITNATAWKILSTAPSEGPGPRPSNQPFPPEAADCETTDWYLVGMSWHLGPYHPTRDNDHVATIIDQRDSEARLVRAKQILARAVRVDQIRQQLADLEAELWALTADADGSEPGGRLLWSEEDGRLVDRPSYGAVVHRCTGWDGGNEETWFPSADAARAYLLYRYSRYGGVLSRDGWSLEDQANDETLTIQR